MNNRRLLYLGITVVVLLVIYLLLQQSSVPVAKPENAVPGLDTARVEAVRIVEGADTVRLAEIGGDWSLVEPISYPASGRVIRQMLDRMEGMIVESVVTRNPDRFAEFGVGDAAKRVTVLEEGRQEVTLLVGNPDPSMTGTYVRRAEGDEVLLVRGAVSGTFHTDVDRWRDRRVVRGLNTGTIAAYAYDDLLLRRRGDTPAFFVVSDRDTLDTDPQRVMTLLSDFVTLRAAAFPGIEERQGVDWDDPEHTIRVTDTSGEAHVFYLYPSPGENDTRWFMLKEGTEVVFGVSRIFVDRLTPPLEELMAKADSGAE